MSNNYPIGVGRMCAVWARSVLVPALLVSACNRPSDIERDAIALAQLDPAAASDQLRGRADSCSGFAGALDRMTRISDSRLARLVDDVVDAARTRCADPVAAVRGTTAAHQLARARLLDDRPAEAILALEPADPAAAVRYRRAELLERTGRLREAIADLDAGLLLQPDEAARASRRGLAVVIAVQENHLAEAAAAIAAAPVMERPSLAFRATAAAQASALDALAAAAEEAELARVVGDRVEHERGLAAAIPARERAVALAGARAEHHDALARALVASGRSTEALAAWDRAATLAPAQPSYQLAPIRALVALGESAEARVRVLALVGLAKRRPDADAFVTASTAAAAVSDHELAVELAREAHGVRPGDGRLRLFVAERFADAGDHGNAIAWLGELLVCGAHGRPWHRHEVAGKLLALATDPAAVALVTQALDATRPCVVDPADLASYVSTLRSRLGPDGR